MSKILKDVQAVRDSLRGLTSALQGMWEARGDLNGDDVSLANAVLEMLDDTQAQANSLVWKNIDADDERQVHSEGVALRPTIRFHSDEYEPDYFHVFLDDEPHALAILFQLEPGCWWLDGFTVASGLEGGIKYFVDTPAAAQLEVVKFLRTALNEPALVEGGNTESATPDQGSGLDDLPLFGGVM